MTWILGEGQSGTWENLVILGDGQSRYFLGRTSWDTPNMTLALLILGGAQLKKKKTVYDTAKTTPLKKHQVIQKLK